MNRVTKALVAASMISTTGVATAAEQAYPSKPIRIITAEVASILDLGARVVAQGLSQNLGQPVIVENRPLLTAEQVKKSTPDGYTLLFFGSSLWVVPLLRKDVAYDPINDFAPITLAMTSPTLLVVNPRIAAKNVQELVAYAKAKPGELNYATSVSGGTPHLAGEMLKSYAGINMVRIAYKGVAPALTDVVGGRVDLMFPTVTSGMPHVKAGKLRALAVTSAKQTVLAPGIPTVAESGVPGYELVAIFGAWAPAKTPPAVVARLNREMVQTITQPEIRQRFLSGGSEVVASPPAQLTAAVKAETVRMAKIIRDQNIRED